MPQPNILLIMSDQHRADVMGCSGDPVARTPHIDRLAAEGIRFENVYCQGPLCMPAQFLDYFLNVHSDSAHLTDAVLSEIRRFYYGSITVIDDGIGRILQAMERRGLLDSTWVIYTSDHGEMMGEHRMLTKMVFYEQAVQVVRPRGRPARRPQRRRPRDETVFRDPDSFEVRRDAHRHLAFGHGIHFCLGAPLARLEATVALRCLLPHLSRARIAGEPGWKPNTVLRGLHHIRLDGAGRQ